ncbi:unnamed protein product [Onchocerca flexuosa]|uniref:Uncharacterized protein n=1 Tax=Onchocerca flexuosa TaxID=387005 RepID=A0A183HFB7_9BILA|nr:unnamed protein product [Onchocerca flexuosa]
MDPNFKLQPEYRSSTASTSPMNEAELDFEPVVTSLPGTTATSVVLSDTAKQLVTQTVGNEDTFDVITSSLSNSSDGSSNEFVKVEHSDLHRSVGPTDNTFSFRMSQLHSDEDDEKRINDRKYSYVIK